MDTKYKATELTGILNYLEKDYEEDKSFIFVDTTGNMETFFTYKGTLIELSKMSLDLKMNPEKKDEIEETIRVLLVNGIKKGEWLVLSLGTGKDFVFNDFMKNISFYSSALLQPSKINDRKFLSQSKILLQADDKDVFGNSGHYEPHSKAKLILLVSIQEKDIETFLKNNPDLKDNANLIIVKQSYILKKYFAYFIFYYKNIQYHNQMKPITTLNVACYFIFSFLFFNFPFMKCKQEVLTPNNKYNNTSNFYHDDINKTTILEDPLKTIENIDESIKNLRKMQTNFQNSLKKFENNHVLLNNNTSLTPQKFRRIKSQPQNEDAYLFYNSLSLIMLAMLAGGLVGIVFILYFSFKSENEDEKPAQTIRTI